MKNKQLHKQIAAALAAGALLAASPVFAAEPEFQLDQIVVTANRMPVKLSETAANVSVITRDEIEKKNYQSLEQALKNVNGVDVSESGHPGAQTIVRLNGNDRVVIMIDGRRINMDKGIGSGRSGFELNNLPSMANIERIEVVKGAASALYGSDAVGGVINIITRKGNENKSTLDLSAGSWGGRNYQFSHQGSNGDWSWLLTAGRQEQDYFSYKDFTDGKSKKMPNSAFDKDNLTLRLDKKIDDSSSITLQVEHATDKSGQPGMVPGRVHPSYGPQHFPHDTRDTLMNNYAVTYNYNTNTDNAGYLRFYENYTARDTYTPSAWDVYSSYTSKSQGIDWQKSWRLDASNTFVSGFEWRDTTAKDSAQYGGSRHSVDNIAVYLENRMSLDDKWTFIPGVRYDRHSTFGHETTPHMSVDYKLDETANAFVSWGRVFNAPNIDDLFSSWGGNPDLKPETGHTATIGINKKLSDQTQVTASYFRSKLSDAINWAQDPADPNSWKPFNVDSQRSDGFEMEIRTELSPQWSLSGAYSYLNVEDKTAGSSDYVRNLKNNQPNGYRVGLDYNQDALSVNITARGASNLSQEYFTSSGYWVMDTAVQYKLGDNARAYFNVFNLTNKAYETIGSRNTDAGVGGYPMPGRNYRFGVQYSF